MTISSEDRVAGPYVGDGATTDYPFGFKIFDADNVQVIEADTAGKETILTSGYTVSLNADQGNSPGGTVSLSTALQNNFTLIITTDIAYLQTLDLTDQGGFYPTTINDAFDRVVIMIQQLSEAVSRAVKATISSGTGPDSLLASIFQAKSDAQSSASAAASSATSAGSSASNANDSANLAQAWATKLGGLVNGAGRSARAWAEGSAIGSAKRWATETASAVTGSLYSAKEWALGTQTRGSAGGGSAKDWATLKGLTADNAEYSASEHATGTTVATGSAKSWATKGTNKVDGTEFSSKEYAQGSSATGGTSKQWAQKTGAKVDAAEYSAKEYAQGSAAAGGTAKEWAAKTDAAVAAGEYSAKWWAQEALAGASDQWASLIKATDTAPCIKKTGAQTLAIEAGTRKWVNDHYESFLVDTNIVMPALATGTDYSVWVHPDGTAETVPDSFWNPASAPVPGAVKIGGGHYGAVSPTETVAGGGFSTSGVTAGGGSMAWTQADVDAIRGFNEFSLWDLAWHVDGEQHGMAYDPLAKAWCAIYFCGTLPHINGISAYNSDVASGTVLPYVPLEMGGDGTLKYAAFNSYTAAELYASHGLKPILYEHALSFFFGVNEGTSLGGAAVTIPATKRQAGFTSRIGIEQATGHQWVIGGPLFGFNGSAYTGVGRGSLYTSSGGQMLLSGNRAIAGDSGSRAAGFGGPLWSSDWYRSGRARGVHRNLGRTAR